MRLDELLARRLILLSGKGGVGKSVVGLALALAARARGKRVLLVEVDTPLEAARRLGGPPSRGHETEVRPGLFTVNLDPSVVMDEYVRHVVPLDVLARRILSSPLYHRFFAAAPGLRELMVLGKIMVLEDARRGLSRRPAWDLIIVDAPATGHGLAFLKVPLAASRAIPVGPVGRNARRVLKLIRDPSRAALVVVALPEEMAIVEALQFHELATRELGITPAAVVLNGCHERRFRDDEEAEILRLTAAGRDGLLEPGIALSAALRAARRQIRRHRLTRFYQRRLRRRLDTPLISLPYLVRDHLGEDDLLLLGERLGGA
jgi:anion-transporting  ArsA/GET3 family ATPase